MVTSGAPWKERAVVSGTGKWRVADGSAVGGACPASPARARSGRRPRRSRSRAALAGRAARPARGPDRQAAPSAQREAGPTMPPPGGEAVTQATPQPRRRVEQVQDRRQAPQLQAREARPRAAAEGGSRRAKASLQDGRDGQGLGLISSE